MTVLIGVYGMTCGKLTNNAGKEGLVCAGGYGWPEATYWLDLTLMTWSVLPSTANPPNQFMGSHWVRHLPHIMFSVFSECHFSVLGNNWHVITFAKLNFVLDYVSTQ